MNYNKKQLQKIKEFYETLAMVIIKNNEWGKKLPRHVEDVLNGYNLILDLIEDIEELEENK